MGRIQLSLKSQTGDPNERIDLEVLDEATALLVADINLDEGAAELRDGDRVIAKLTKRGSPEAAFWEVSPG